MLGGEGKGGGGVVELGQEPFTESLNFNYNIALDVSLGCNFFLRGGRVGYIGGMFVGARRATFCIKYPGSSPKFILTQGSPPSRLHWTANLPCKASCTSRNMRIQQHKMSLRI